MKKSIKQHLESITAENLEDFRHDAFISMASFIGKNGNYSLGVNGKGMYVVKANNETYLFQSDLFQSASAAIERYKECVSDESSNN